MLNRIVFQGRLTKDIELKQTQSGINYANFTIAWSEKYQDTEVKCFMRCKAWRQTAEFIDKYFHSKGSEILAEGRCETEEWESNGEKRSQTVMRVDKVHFVHGNKAESQNPTDAPKPAIAEIADEDLPF